MIQAVERGIPLNSGPLPNEGLSYREKRWSCFH